MSATWMPAGNSLQKLALLSTQRLDMKIGSLATTRYEPYGAELFNIFDELREILVVTALKTGSDVRASSMPWIDATGIAAAG